MPKPTNLAARTAADPMCYPQLDPTKEIFLDHPTFAKRLKHHIDFVLEKDLQHAEDPTQIIIY